MVERDLAKVDTRVRFPSLAPLENHADENRHFLLLTRNLTKNSESQFTRRSPFHFLHRLSLLRYLPLLFCLLRSVLRNTSFLPRLIHSPP